MATGNFLQNGILEEIWHGVDGCRVWLGTKKEYIFQKGVIPNDTLICFTDGDDFEGVTFTKVSIVQPNLNFEFSDSYVSPDWVFMIDGKRYTKSQVKDIVNIVEHKQKDIGVYKTSFQLLDPTKYIWDNGKTTIDPITWTIVPKVVPLPKLSVDEIEFTDGYVYPTILNYDSTIMTIDGDTIGRKVGTYTITIQLVKKGYLWSDGTTNKVKLTWKIIKHTLFDTDHIYFDDVHKKHTSIISYYPITIKSATADLLTLSNDYDSANGVNTVLFTSNNNRGEADYVFSTDSNKGLDTPMKVVVDYPVTDIINGQYTNKTSNLIIQSIIDETYDSSDDYYNDTIMDIINGGYSVG